MPDLAPDLAAVWQCVASENPPSEFVRAVREHTDGGSARLAVLLWNRHVRDADALPGFLDPDRYSPTSPFAFGEEMQRAVRRLTQARDRRETVAIWGDFDADGVTATAVLWDGLGQFFERSQQLFYTIPNRLTDSHGLNRAGIDRLAESGVRLIVTCDTGSTNLDEIHHARDRGIDIVVTDHHTLLDDRPPVVALINPRNLPENHPLYHLSGVAVAYKLVEALYAELPDVPNAPLEHLLDLVAIGLIADLVELRGDCRYLAQRGLQHLQTQLKPDTCTRPGVGELLRRCKRTGDRPTDVSFGIGPRINAVSRVQGDASFCVELLTHRDPHRCAQLAEDTELANIRRKELQQRVSRSARVQLAQLDLSTTSVIVLSDPQWDVGVLGLVAGEIASEFGRPTVLLWEDLAADPPMARGSARSVDRLDLYRLVNAQSHLLHRFGGHPFAAGLSLRLDNLPLFAEAINRELVEELGRSGGVAQTVPFDLDVTVGELNRELFQELRQIEPCGMGNPPPRLLLRNCWFENAKHRNLKAKHQKIRYILTEFEVWDETATEAVRGAWWGHYADELPPGRCDAIAEFDINTYKHRYELRLIDVRPSQDAPLVALPDRRPFHLLDWRTRRQIPTPHPPLLDTCPHSWAQLQQWFRTLRSPEAALAYAEPAHPEAEAVWQKLIGVAKYLHRTEKGVAVTRLQAELAIGDRPLKLGIEALQSLGFRALCHEGMLHVLGVPEADAPLDGTTKVRAFQEAVCEEQFRRRYFVRVSLETIEAAIES